MSDDWTQLDRVGVERFAKEAAAAGRFHDAALAWQSYRNNGNPDDVQAWFGECQALVDANDYDAAGQTLPIAIAKYPEEFRLAQLHTIVALRQKNWDAATESARYLVGRFADVPQAWATAADALIEAGRLDDAERLLVPTRERLPNELPIETAYAVIATRRNDHAEAHNRWASIREHFPNAGLAYRLGAEALAGLDRCPEAERLVVEGMERCPEDFWLASLHADLAERSNNHSAALSRWRDVSRRFPSQPRSYAGWYANAYKLDLLAEAEAALVARMENCAGFDWMVEQAAEIAIRRRNWQTALERWHLVREHLPTRVRGYTGAIEALRELGRETEAKTMLRDAAERFSEDPDLQLQALQIGIEKRDSETALKAFEKARNVLAQMSPLSAQSFYRELLRLAQLPEAQPFLPDIADALLREQSWGRTSWAPQLADAMNVIQGKEFRENFIRSLSTCLDQCSYDYAQFPATLIAQVIVEHTIDTMAVKETIERLISTGRIHAIVCLISFEEIRLSLIPIADNIITRELRIELMDARFIFLLLIAFAVDQQDRYQALIGALRANGKSALGDRTEESDAAAILDRLVASYAENDVRSSAPSIITARDRPLNVAVCISGQLRGFRQAAPTWSKLGLSAHRQHNFVHVWRNTGRRLLNAPDSSARVLTPDIAQAYTTISKRIGPEGFLRRFPGLRRLFEQPSLVQDSDLRDVYRTTDIVIEDDDSGVFLSYSNQMKMFYKIYSAHVLAKDKKEDFDLIIRIRPDIALKIEGDIDWNRMHYLFRKSNTMLTDIPHRFVTGAGFWCGDMIGVGTPEAMNVYCGAWPLLFSEDRRRMFGFPEVMIGHHVLGYLTFRSGIRVDTIPTLSNVYHCDPDLISPASVLEIVRDDIGGRALDDLDRMLLAGCESDLSGAGQDF
jgi:predicted Zn-dependent protease